MILPSTSMQFFSSPIVLDRRHPCLMRRPSLLRLPNTTISQSTTSQARPMSSQSHHSTSGPLHLPTSLDTQEGPRGMGCPDLCPLRLRLLPPPTRSLPGFRDQPTLPAWYAAGSQHMPGSHLQCRSFEGLRITVVEQTPKSVALNQHSCSGLSGHTFVLQAYLGK